MIYYKDLRSATWALARLFTGFCFAPGRHATELQARSFPPPRVNSRLVHGPGRQRQSPEPQQQQQRAEREERPQHPPGPQHASSRRVPRALPRARASAFNGDEGEGETLAGGFHYQPKLPGIQWDIYIYNLYMAASGCISH